MARQKLSVSVPEGLARFVDAYRDEHGLATKSQVVARALELLRAADLEEAYARASREVDPGWEVASSDGLEDDAT
jgi:Arc/MetJ-type ribon-helix-helix transcriptional regulator